MAGFGNQRTWQAARLLARGRATIKEILQVNYGEWPLRGLDIVTDEHLNHEVALKSKLNLHFRNVGRLTGSRAQIPQHLRELFSAFKWSGAASALEDRTIWIGRLRVVRAFVLNGRQILNTWLAHERRHIQQSDFAHPRKASEVFGHSFVDEGAVGKGIPIVDVEITGMIRKHLTEMSLAQRIWRQFVTLNRSSWRPRRLRYLRYLQEGKEIQARLEELLIAGYPHWPHMPLSKPQLWAAMLRAGLKPPRNFYRELAADPVFYAAHNRFSASVHPSRQAVFEINRAVRNLPSRQAQETFWREGLPILYSDILESFGDRQGRARMGFGMNQTLPLLLFGKDYDACHQPDIPDSVVEDIRNKTQLLGAEESALFIEKYYHSSPESPLAQNSLAARRFITAVAEAPGVRAVLERENASVLEWLNNHSTPNPADPSRQSPTIRPREHGR